MLASAVARHRTPSAAGSWPWARAIGGGLACCGSANRGIAAGQAGAADVFSRLFGGGGGGAAAPAPSDVLSGGSGTDTLSGAGGGMADYRNAIAGIESSGRYDAIGPTNAKLGRPLGKYQVMEANLGPWSKAALGAA